MADGDSLIEATDEWTLVPLPAVIAQRRSQRSYHIFSEQNARGQIFNLAGGERLDPLTFDGNLLLMLVSGCLEISLNGAVRTMPAGSQILINPGVEFSVKATESSSFEVIWMPPFAAVTRANDPHET